MTMLRAGFADLMAPGLFDVIALAYKQYPDEYSKIFKVKTSNRKYETATTIENIGAASEKTEGASVGYSDLTQGYDTTFTHKTFAVGARVTREAYDDDLYSVFRDKLGQYLARSMKQRWEILGANVLNNGFTASYSGGGISGTDAKALFASDHPWASGGTWSNLLSPAADLTPTSLQTLLTQVETATEANSVNIALIPKTLIVPPALRWDASVILESQLKSGGANNDKNPLLDLNLSYMVNHYLTDTDAWFIQCDYHGLVFFDRQRPKLEADDDFDSGDAKVKMTGRASAGYDDPMGMFGSAGA